MKTVRDKLLFEGLTALTSSAFPKVCGTCGREYKDLQEFLDGTQPISVEKSGLKASQDDDELPLVELYRNCSCGSTLMDLCRSRRDESADGQRRRIHFTQLMEHLVQRGLTWEQARSELLMLLQGKVSLRIEELLNSD